MEDMWDQDEKEHINQVFEQLVNQYQTMLLRTCYIYLRDRMQAEDAVQETFIKAYRNLSQFRKDSSYKTWLLKIAFNTCHDMRKTSWFLHVNPWVTPDMLPEKNDILKENGSDETLLTQVMNLPTKLKEVVLLYYYHNLDTYEIADTLGIARSSVSSRLQRARKKLREALERMVSDERA